MLSRSPLTPTRVTLSLTALLSFAATGISGGIEAAVQVIGFGADGQVRTQVPLGPELSRQFMSVELIGTQLEGEVPIKSLPEGVHLTYAHILPQLTVATLPLSLRVDEGIRGQDFTLIFVLTTPSGPQLLRIPVRWPRLAHLLVQGPQQIAVLPDSVARVPFNVQNDGTAETDVKVSSEAGAVEPSTFHLSPGEVRTVALLLPPSRGDRDAVVVFQGGGKRVNWPLRIHGGLGATAPYGIQITAGTSAGTTEGEVSGLRVDGVFSRLTAVQAALEVRQGVLSLRTLKIQHGDARLEVADSNPGNPAGEAGRGAYLSYTWRATGVLQAVALGAVVPASGTPRLGVATRWQGANWSATAAADSTVQGGDPEFALTGTYGPLSGAAALTPGRSELWKFAGAYHTDAVDFSVGAAGGVQSWGAAQVRWNSGVFPVLGIRANLLSGAFSDVTVSGTYGQTSASVSRSASGTWSVNAATAYRWNTLYGQAGLTLNADPGGFRGGVMNADLQGEAGVTSWALSSLIFLNERGVSRASLKASTLTPLGNGALVGHLP